MGSKKNVAKPALCLSVHWRDNGCNCCLLHTVHPLKQHHFTGLCFADAASHIMLSVLHYVQNIQCLFLFHLGSYKSQLRQLHLFYSISAVYLWQNLHLKTHNFISSVPSQPKNEGNIKVACGFIFEPWMFKQPLLTVIRWTQLRPVPQDAVYTLYVFTFYWNIICRQSWC